MFHKSFGSNFCTYSTRVSYPINHFQYTVTVHTYRFLVEYIVSSQ